MNRMSEQELPNLQNVRDRLIANKASHVVEEAFYLVVPTDGANCYLLDSQSLRIVGALTWWQEPAKQTRHLRWCASRLSDA